MTKPKLKSLLIVKICYLLLAEEMDNLKDTTAYKQDIKNLINRLSEKLDREYVDTYKLYIDDGAAEQGLNYFIDIFERFVDQVKDVKSAEHIIELGLYLEKFKSGL